MTAPSLTEENPIGLVLPLRSGGRQYAGPMPEATMGPCGPWITPDDVIAYCGSKLGDDPDLATLNYACTFATNILFRLSGRRFMGLCDRTVQPCFGNNHGCCYSDWSSAFLWWAAGAMVDPLAYDYPYRFNGQWFDSGACCSQRCWLPRVKVPGPIADVTQVVIDGVVLPADAYRVDRHREIVRVDGAAWPCGNDLTKDPSPYVGPNDGSKDGTWQISYVYGRGPGGDGELAATVFASEVALELCNSLACNLPARLKHIVREGVEMDFADPLTFLDDGKVGIYLVDMWIKSVNRNGLDRRARLVDMTKPRNVTQR